MKEVEYAFYDENMVRYMRIADCAGAAHVLQGELARNFQAVLHEANRPEGDREVLEHEHRELKALCLKHQVGFILGTSTTSRKS